MPRECCYLEHVMTSAAAAAWGRLPSSILSLTPGMLLQIRVHHQVHHGKERGRSNNRAYGHRPGSSQRGEAAQGSNEWII